MRTLPSPTFTLFRLIKCADDLREMCMCMCVWLGVGGGVWDCFIYVGGFIASNSLLVSLIYGRERGYYTPPTVLH